MPSDRTQNNISRKTYTGLDILKFIMAISVVAIHTEPLPIRLGWDIDAAKLCSSFIYLAVPFFFLCSGFLIRDHAETETQFEAAILKHSLKSLKLYLLWSLIYLPLAVYFYMHVQGTMLDYANDYLRGLLFRGEHYNSWMLWYLLSLVYGLLFTWGLRKCRLPLWMIVLAGAAIGYFAITLTLYTRQMVRVPGGIIGSAFRRMQEIFGNGRIFTGLFYLPLGMWIAECRGKILSKRKQPQNQKQYQDKTQDRGRGQHQRQNGIPDQIKISRSLLPVMAAAVLFASGYIAELLSPGIGYLYEFGRVLASVGILLFGVQISSGIAPFDKEAHSVQDEAGTDKLKLPALLRGMSTSIYFLHLYVWTASYMFLYPEKSGIVQFLLTTGMTVLIALGLQLLKNRRLENR